MSQTLTWVKRFSISPVQNSSLDPHFSIFQKYFQSPSPKTLPSQPKYLGGYLWANTRWQVLYDHHYPWVQGSFCEQAKVVVIRYIVIWWQLFGFFLFEQNLLLGFLLFFSCFHFFVLFLIFAVHSAFWKIITKSKLLTVTETEEEHEIKSSFKKSNNSKFNRIETYKRKSTYPFQTCRKTVENVEDQFG